MKLIAFRFQGLFTMLRREFSCMFVTVSVFSAGVSSIFGQEQPRSSPDVPRDISQKILSEVEWREVESAIDKGLAFLSRKQLSNGAFQQTQQNEPGISALCVLAFMSRGHLPSQGPYGDKLSKSVEFLLGCQQADGLLSQTRQSFHSPYNHSICALVLAELYGMTRPADEGRFRQVIDNAIEFTSHRYPQPKQHAEDQGSWRYLVRRANSDGDLSATSWNVMFLRSAKNSGFNVDVKIIDESLAYLKRLYDPHKQTFRYEIHAEDPHNNYPRGMAGAGLLSLSLSGDHNSNFARNAAKYILKQPFDQFERPNNGEEYPCYGAFYCSQGMFHMGGEYWSEFYPRLVKTLLKAQRSDGSWLLKQGLDVQYGPAYMTALTVLALTPPYQMLPIFQR